MKISKANAEHYTWGNQCDGWHLVKQTDLSIIHEKMPPHTNEARHFHEKARQFFFILSGTATMELDGERIILCAHEGIEIPPYVRHQMMNQSDHDLEFILISQPNSKGDRITVDEVS